MFRVLYSFFFGIVFLHRDIFLELEKKILRYAIQKEHTTEYQDYSLDQHQRIDDFHHQKDDDGGAFLPSKNDDFDDDDAQDDVFSRPASFFRVFFCIGRGSSSFWTETSPRRFAPERRCFERGRGDGDGTGAWSGTDDVDDGRRRRRRRTDDSRRANETTSVAFARIRERSSPE